MWYRNKPQTYRLTYDAFGNMTALKVGNKALAIYTYGSGSGQLLSRSRYYDSVVGRFVCADSCIMSAQGITGNNKFTQHNMEPWKEKSS